MNTSNIWLSKLLCCTPESNRTLYVSYTGINNKNKLIQISSTNIWQRQFKGKMMGFSTVVLEQLDVHRQIMSLDTNVTIYKCIWFENLHAHKHLPTIAHDCPKLEATKKSFRRRKGNQTVVQSSSGILSHNFKRGSICARTWMKLNAYC